MKAVRLRVLTADHPYAPALWDLGQDPAARAHWTGVFHSQIASMLQLLDTHRGRAVRDRAETALEPLFDLMRSPDGGHPALPHVHSWTLLRERCLRDAGLADPYAEVKRDDNRRALDLLPQIAARLQDVAPYPARLRRAVAGVFAGNLFDHGSPATLRGPARTLADEIRFQLDQTWLHDHSSALSTALCEGGVKRIVVLADNAGVDFLCGVLPLSLVLLERVQDVVIAANELPALNDVTAGEADHLLGQAGEVWPGLADAIGAQRLRVISTGNGAPGIDLSQVSCALDVAVNDCDLLILEGQGRAVETNWLARLDLPTLRLCAVKDPMVAGALGGQLFDVVCELRPPAAGPCAPRPKLHG